MKSLSFQEKKKLFSKYKIPVCPEVLIRSQGEVLKLAEKIGYPLVLKISAPEIIHKTEIGAVRTGITNKKQAKASYDEIIDSVKKAKPKTEIEGVLMQKEKKGTEIILGMKRDLQFGPVLMIGLGGVFVEILKDIAFRIAPVKKKEALRMMKELKAWPVFKGYRNFPSLNTELIADFIVKVSELSLKEKEIKEIDFNPVIANQKEVLSVDSKILI